MEVRCNGHEGLWERWLGLLGKERVKRRYHEFWVYQEKIGCTK